MGWYNMENPEDTEMKGTLRSILLVAALGAGVADAAGNGAYIDRSAPQRYCVIESGQWGWFGQQTFLHCAQGWNNAGHTFVAGLARDGVEYLLYRLQADGGYMSPVVVNSVTLRTLSANEIEVRFGTPGAQSPAYRLTSTAPTWAKPWFHQ